MGFGRSCCKVFTVSLVPVTVFILSLLFFCGIILLPILYSELAYKQQYGIVIDAGSSHTHIYLYSWQVSSSNYTSQVKQISSCRPNGPGISTYTNATLAGNSTYLCLMGLLNRVPKEYKDNVHVWLGATAGMRLLKYENKTFADDILKNSRRTLKHLNLNNRNVRIISGAEEGASGWITVNYMLRKLKKEYPRKRDLSTSTSSLGALDMGGASTQITFQNTPSTVNHSQSATLFGQHWDVYARSYLCFGVIEAYRRSLAYLVKINNYTTSVDNPCLPNGTNLNYSQQFLFTNHACTKDLISKKLNITDEVVFTGTSNSSQCLEIIEKSLNFSHCFADGSVKMDCVNDPLPDVNEKEFVAFSEFSYIQSYFNVSKLNRTSFTKLITSVESLCNRNWSELTKGHLPSYFLKLRCFDALYMVHTLKTGFGFSTSKGSWNISIKHELNGIDAGWALGYMLNNTYPLDKSPSATVSPYSSADLIVGILVLTILTIVFVVFFIFTFSACRKALKPITTGYTNIS